MKIKISPQGSPHAGEARNVVCRLSGPTVAADAPRVVTDGGWRPMCSILNSATGLRSTLCVRGLTVGCFVDTGSGTQTVHTIAEFSSDILAIHPVGKSAAVMTASGIGFLDPSSSGPGGWTLRPGQAIPSAITLYAASECSLSANVGSRTLSREYSRAYRLESSDLKAIASDLRDAYGKLKAQAAASLLFVQPVVARWKLVDAEGVELYTSPHLMLTPSDGYQGCASMAVDGTTDSNSRTVLEAYSVKVNAFAVEVRIPDTAAALLSELGASLVVEVSPGIDPIDFSRDPVYNLNPRQSTSPLLHLALPGSDTATAHAASDICALVERWDSLASTFITISSKAVRHTSPSLPGYTSDTPIRLLLQAPLPPSASVDAALLPPNVLTASGRCQSGNVVVWSRLRAYRFSGYEPSRYAVTRSAVEADAAMAYVNFSDGQRVVSQEPLPVAFPARLSPLICYPDPEAVSLRIAFRKGDVSRRLDLPLTPSPCGRFAFWLHPSHRPFDPLAEEGLIDAPYIVPVERSYPREFPDRVGVASSDAPLSLSSVASVGGGEVKAVAPAPGSGSAWDFAAPKFVVFSTEGIHSLAISATSGLRVKGVRLLDPRSVREESCVCASPMGVYALAGGDLVKVRRTDVQTVATGLHPFRRISWCGAELWLASDDSLLAFRPGSKAAWRSLTPSAGPDSRIDAFLPTPDGRLYAFDSLQATISDLSSGGGAGEVDVRWTAEADVAGMSLRRLELGMFSAHCDLRLRVAPARHPAAAPLLSVRISGRVAAPLIFPILYPKVELLAVTLEGKAAPGSEFSHIIINP